MRTLPEGALALHEGRMDTTHPAGCTFGGFSCGYWLIAEGCELEHWEKHYVLASGSCPCGTEFPGASSVAVFLDATDDDEVDPHEPTRPRD